MQQHINLKCGEILGKVTITEILHTKDKPTKYEVWCSVCGFHSVVTENDIINGVTKCC